jgi:DNA processing protein
VEADKLQLHTFVGFAERQLRLASSRGGLILTLSDPQYPRGLLAARSFAPPVLHALGRIDAFGTKRLAIVGTRNPSSAAVLWSRDLAQDAVAAGYSVVSGLALGIDAAGHTAALDAGGDTVAILGCGVDMVYPPENRELYRRLAESGLLLSEFPFGVAPSGDLLRKRNKVIVASADAVVLAECPTTSGTMIAARAAIQQRKPLFAFAGGADADPSRGSGTALLIEAGLAAVLQPGGGVQAIEQGIAHYVPPAKGDRRFGALASKSDDRRTRPSATDRGPGGAKHRSGAAASPSTSTVSQQALPKIATSERPASEDDEQLTREAATASPRTSEPVRVGDRVRHPKFGEGTVVATDDGSPGQVVEIRFTGLGKRGRKRIDLSIVPVERV